MAGVWLRDWDRGDTAAIASILNDPQVLNWSPIAEGEAACWIDGQRATPGLVSKAVCDQRDASVVGKVALRLVETVSLGHTHLAVRPEEYPIGELSSYARTEPPG